MFVSAIPSNGTQNSLVVAEVTMWESLSGCVSVGVSSRLWSIGARLENASLPSTVLYYCGDGAAFANGRRKPKVLHETSNCPALRQIRAKDIRQENRQGQSSN